MFYEKIIKISVFSSKNPIYLRIYTLDGNLLFYGFVNNNSTFCVCTCSQKIAVGAQFNGQTQTQYFNLTNYRCQNLSVYFNFNTQNNATQNFILLDKTYNFPIESATLNFLSN